jgi:ketosteroid isomerase-like protein
MSLSPAMRREIVEACERLVLDYAHLADAGRMDELAQLFAEDAEVNVSGQVHKGREALRKAFSATQMATLHCTFNIRIEVISEDRAEGTSYGATYAKPQDGPGTVAVVAPAAVGIRHDRYRRAADGWRFESRSLEPFLTRATS